MKEPMHPLDRKKSHSNSINSYFKRRKLSDPVFHLRTIFSSRKSVAKAKGIEFSVSLEDIPYTGLCPILGISLCYKGDMGSSPSIDRIDPSKGYVKGNVRWISHKANRWKSDMSIEDVKTLLDNFYKT